MADGASDEATLSAYADAQARLEHAGGYRWRDGIEVALHGLGFADAELDRPLASFSGGELTRASLARALASRPDLLLLDEPTNHLDIASLEWLEAYLVDLDAAVILVAHDRWFLESVGTSVLELEAGRGRYFKGPWHAWRAEQAARELAAGRDAARREAEIARMERFVERFRYKATKARQAQSKLKHDRPPAPRTRSSRTRATGARSRSRFGAAERSGQGGARARRGDDRRRRPDPDRRRRPLARARRARLPRRRQRLGQDARWSRPWSASAIAGGAKLRRGHNVKLGYLSQHPEVGGGPEATVLTHAQRATGLSEAKTRALLGRFLFSGEEVEKRLTEISGGEAQRLALALLTNSDANLLVLDEPTNHLDLESREALEDALTAYGGAVLLISHDRALLEAVGSRTLVIEDRALRSHPGGWAEYRSAAEAEEAAGAEDARGAEGQAPRAPPARARTARRSSRGSSARWRRPRPRSSGSRTSSPTRSHWSSPERSARSSARHERARARLDELIARWEEAAERVEG